MRHFILTMVDTPNDFTEEDIRDVIIEQKKAIILTYYKDPRGVSMGSLVLRGDREYDAHGTNIVRERQALNAIYDVVMSNAKDAEKARQEMKGLGN